MMNLRKLPVEERPRERLIRWGAEVLSLVELLAILLTTGTKNKSVLELSQELLERFGSLYQLMEASIEELMEVKGIGRAKAIQLKAAFGIALQANRRQWVAKKVVGPEEAYELVRHELIHQKQELLIVILKDVKGKLITWETVAIGTLSNVLVHPREVFFPAVRHKASSLILVHNHPSGDPTPSKADITLTQHLIKSSQVMGILLEDHLIIGASSFVSLQRVGLFR